MAAKLQFQPLHFQIQFLLLILFSTSLPSSHSTPQNIQVYFPTPTPPPLLLSPTTPPPETTAATSLRSSNKPIAKAIAITASCTLVLSGLLFFLLFKLKHSSKKETINLYADNRINYSNDNLGLHKNENFLSFGSIKRVIVDDEQRKLHDNSGRKSKFDFNVQEIYFIREKSSVSRVWPSSAHIPDSSQIVDLENVKNQETMKIQALLQSSPPPPPPPPPLPRPNVEVPPPAPPVVGKKGNAPMPPLPPKSNGLTFPPQRPPPPPPPKGDMSLSSENKVKLKPLYWDKVNANVGHDMVWHQLHNGSFRSNLLFHQIASYHMII